ncbi:MAG: hypothetical protein JST86_19930 [Bacteroidetes bacterium]|nr:hypothetical protein [Bacteroidota bacterium]
MLTRIVFYCKMPAALLLLYLIVIIPTSVSAQSQELNEQQLEQVTAANNDTETDDDAYLQQLNYYRQHPLHLNQAEKDELESLGILNTLQVQSFLHYRKLLGKLVDIHELQAVPGWSLDVIKSLLPYVTVTDNAELYTTIKKRLSGADRTLLIRAAEVFPLAKGYQQNTAASHYEGGPLKLMFRYSGQYKKSLYYGIVGDKDAGEPFFRNKQKFGFDFYSAHLFIRDVGCVKALALGDYTVNLGQGLIQWQNLAFGKSAAVLNIKREAPVLNPYRSPGEINFYRGAAVTIGKGHYETTVFLSSKNTDGNLVQDSVAGQIDYFTSLQTSGYHRTNTEIADKGSLHLLSAGGNLRFKKDGFHAGLNFVQHYFSKPINKPDEPYNLYALKGSSLKNYSADYSLSFRNMHWFGEYAVNPGGHYAAAQGMLISINPKVDMSVLYRSVSKAYQSLYSNAFTENSLPSNEKGLYAGISIHPGNTWHLDAYTDWFSFPWLKYEVDAPLHGVEYLLQSGFTPNRKVSVTSRYYTELKAGNYNTDLSPLNPVEQVLKQTWRNDVTCNINAALALNFRTELLWLKNANRFIEHGYLSYLGCKFKPARSHLMFTCRWAYFETDSYNSRIYAYENDVLYSFSIPSFYGEGSRYYINVNYDFTRRLSLWARYSQTVYSNKTLIGSGLETIQGNKKAEIRLECLYKF